jgi:hypothetical protein
MFFGEKQGLVSAAVSKNTHYQLRVKKTEKGCRQRMISVMNEEYILLHTSLYNILKDYDHEILSRLHVIMQAPEIHIPIHHSHINRDQQ